MSTADKQVERVVIETTQPKAITFATDTKLRYKAIIAFVKLAPHYSLLLRQSCVRVSKKH